MASDPSGPNATIRQRLLSARRRFRDAVCAIVGHRWRATYNPGRQECARCFRAKYMMIDRATGETSWLVGG